MLTITDGVGPTMENPFTKVGCWTPVAAVTVLKPGAVPASMDNCALAEVGLFTVTGPNPPGAPPPTLIPAPKLAWVLPCTKFVNWPERVVAKDCPGCPEAGLTSIAAAGMMFKDEALLLAKARPDADVPATDTEYWVGSETLIALGI
jgi:hypothetical protein